MLFIYHIAAKIVFIFGKDSHLGVFLIDGVILHL